MQKYIRRLPASENELKLRKTYVHGRHCVIIYSVPASLGQLGEDACRGGVVLGLLVVAPQ